MQIKKVECIIVQHKQIWVPKWHFNAGLTTINIDANFMPFFYIIHIALQVCWYFQKRNWSNFISHQFMGCVWKECGYLFKPTIGGPRDTWPQARRSSTMNVFEKGRKKFEMHVFLINYLRCTFFLEVRIYVVRNL